MPEDREEEQQETYHKVDRRTGHRDDEAGTDPAPAAEAEEPAPEDQMPAEPGDEVGPEAVLPEIDMYGLLRMMFGMCVEQAWVHLGLQLAPGAKETKADLAQARMAIDTIAFIKQTLGDTLSAAEQREVDQTLTTLRMNFVQRS